MFLYDLGSVPWAESQLIYHALPRLGRESLVLLSPAEPYVCIGYHQDLAQEVDVEFCRANGIPIFRREVGGGGTYLDNDQLFYQLIMHKDNPLAPGDKSSFYRKFLQPPIDTYRELGIPAEYKPVNDIIARNRKISGNGAGEIGDYLVLVGNLILDFNYDMMSRILKVPDEKFRDKVYKSMRENLSTIKRELGSIPPRDSLTSSLARNFEKVLGPLPRAGLDEELTGEVSRLKAEFSSEEWLFKIGRPTAGRTVKIASGVEVKHLVHKAPGGLIRGDVELADGVISSIVLSGDFFFFPAEKLSDLQRALVGKRPEEVEQTIADFYEEQGIESPGVEPSDFARVVVG
ncbi:MAG: lipoate--protein ligase [Anaerolineae bacterium]|nr:lipoate--protein ligase [Anaerolineae bacterium]